MTTHALVAKGSHTETYVLEPSQVYSLDLVAQEGLTMTEIHVSPSLLRSLNASQHRYSRSLQGLTARRLSIQLVLTRSILLHCHSLPHLSALTAHPTSNELYQASRTPTLSTAGRSIDTASRSFQPSGFITALHCPRHTFTPFRPSVLSYP